MPARFRAALLSAGASLALIAATSVPALAAVPTPETRTDADPPAVAGQLLIKFKRATPAARRLAAVEAHGGRVFDRIAALDVEAAEFPSLTGRADPRARDALLRSLKRLPDVESVEPNLIYQASFVPNDPGLGNQYAWSRIQATAAWDVARGSASTVIAVVDTGVQRTHPDLDAKIRPGYDYVGLDTAPDDGNGHGTHVAGTAAAETDNATGGAGTCPNCSVMPVRVLDNSGSGTLVNVANGIRFAADNGARVINLSLGGGGSSTLQSAVDYAWGRGVFLACAAGNSNTSSTANAYPAAYPNCFAVAATTSSDARASYSNYGSWVEAAAPGSSIYSTWLGSGYNTISGTSMATPHVAGLAGLLAGQGLTNAQIRDRICATSDRIAGTGSYWTCGRINAQRAVTNVGTPPPPPPQSLVNGGFENGTGPWSQVSSGGYNLITTNRPHTGAYSAWLGGYNGGSDAVSQTVTVPSNGTLTYWWYMTTQESGATPYDYLRVSLYSGSGALLATLRTYSNASGAGQWRQDSVSLAGYAGQSVRVSFTGTTDQSLPSSFYVDDVTLS
jgi:subtilisin family serine protease